MPTLNWIGKEKIINHHLDVPYRVLDHQYGFTEKGKQKTETNSGNKIIHGDNLEALKSLLPEYEGKIKCIYIDPPYNTGNEGWVYNDNVSHPKLQKWLEKTLNAKSEGKEAYIGTDDLTRHDKWLCMMYPRLKLLHRLLADDGAIFISIDDNEVSSLKLMMNEIFGVTNFISSNIRQGVKGGTRSRSIMASNHDYIVIYCKNFSLVEIKGKDVEGVVLNQTDEKGPYKKGRELNKWGAGSAREDSPTMWFPIKGPKEEDVYPIRNDGSEGRWRWGKKKLLKAVEEKEVIFEKRFDGTYIVYEKIRTDENREIAHSSLLTESIYSNANGSEIIKDIFQENKSRFSFPKPISLVEHFVGIITNETSIILDSFAGSGTTAHAVLNLNKQDGGNRKFILVELENYAETITAERIKRVINGYGETEGTGGSFNYYTVGEPLFDNDQNLNEIIATEKIREYIWYSETRSPYKIQETSTPFLGIHNDTGYYFIYDKKELTTLDYDSLADYVTQKSERYIIYADNCLLPESFLRAKNIEFKKIPRNITRF